MIKRSTAALKPADLDQAFHALADPARRAMVQRLAQGPASVSDLARPLPMSLPAVVQHLRVLEAGGLVRTEKSGRVRMCALEPAALDDVADWLAEQKRLLAQKLDRLAAYVASMPDEEGTDDEN